jgi:hypothetical protein
MGYLSRQLSSAQKKNLIIAAVEDGLNYGDNNNLDVSTFVCRKNYYRTVSLAS